MKTFASVAFFTTLLLVNPGLGYAKTDSGAYLAPANRELVNFFEGKKSALPKRLLNQSGFKAAKLAKERSPLKQKVFSRGNEFCVQSTIFLTCLEPSISENGKVEVSVRGAEKKFIPRGESFSDIREEWKNFWQQEGNNSAGSRALSWLLPSAIAAEKKGTGDLLVDSVESDLLVAGVTGWVYLSKNGEEAANFIPKRNRDDLDASEGVKCAGKRAISKTPGASPLTIEGMENDSFRITMGDEKKVHFLAKFVNAKDSQVCQEAAQKSAGGCEWLKDGYSHRDNIDPSTLNLQTVKDKKEFSEPKKETYCDGESFLVWTGDGKLVTKCSKLWFNTRTVMQARCEYTLKTCKLPSPASVLKLERCSDIHCNSAQNTSPTKGETAMLGNLDKGRLDRLERLKKDFLEIAPKGNFTSGQINLNTDYSNLSGSEASKAAAAARDTQAKASKLFQEAEKIRDDAFATAPGRLMEAMLLNRDLAQICESGNPALRAKVYENSQIDIYPDKGNATDAK